MIVKRMREVTDTDRCCLAAGELILVNELVDAPGFATSGWKRVEAHALHGTQHTEDAVGIDVVHPVGHTTS